MLVDPKKRGNKHRTTKTCCLSIAPPQHDIYQRGARPMNKKPCPKRGQQGKTQNLLSSERCTPCSCTTIRQGETTNKENLALNRLLQLTFSFCFFFRRFTIHKTNARKVQKASSISALASACDTVKNGKVNLPV